LPRPARRPRDAGATRAALLARAIGEFADRGYDGARIDEIAHSAGINKRMIYAYFGDKAGLYRAALDACLTSVLEVAQEGDAPSTGSLRQRTEAIVRRFFDYLSVHPEAVRLLAWEALSREKRGRRILLRRLEGGLEPLRAIVRQGVEAGQFRRDLDPRVFVLAVDALLLGYFNQRHLVEALWKADLSTPAAGEAVLAQFLRILLDGIEESPS
jgi:TetR/AcrR family transcriptional regulator